MNMQLFRKQVFAFFAIIDFHEENSFYFSKSFHFFFTLKFVFIQENKY